VAIPAAETMQMPIERFIFSIARPNMFRCGADRQGMRRTSQRKEKVGRHASLQLDYSRRRR
jgi:hypothetical protein